MTHNGVIEGVFERRLLRGDAEHLRLDSLPTGWFAISHRWIEPTTARRQGRGRWYSIHNPESGNCIFRALRLEPTLRVEAGSENTTPSGEIWIDYDGWLELSGLADDNPRSMPLRICRARWWQTARLAEKHPDPAYRLAARVAWILGLVSILLGVVSILLTVLPRQ
jgi:hypothetical protein